MKNAAVILGLLMLSACGPSIAGYSGDGVTVRKSAFNSTSAAQAEADRACAMKGGKARYLGTAGHYGGWFGADSDVTFACVKE